jgi:hypothetical protein
MEPQTTPSQSELETFRRLLQAEIPAYSGHCDPASPLLKAAQSLLLGFEAAGTDPQLTVMKMVRNVIQQYACGTCKNKVDAIKTAIVATDRLMGD